METEFQNQIIAGSMVGVCIGIFIYDMILTVLKWIRDYLDKLVKRGERK